MAESDNALNTAILRELRTDLRRQLTLLLQLADAAQRHDRRFAEMDRRFAEMDRRFDEMGHRIAESRDELELMLKSELMGRFTHFETQMDERLAQLDDRIAILESARP